MSGSAPTAIATTLHDERKGRRCHVAAHYSGFAKLQDTGLYLRVSLCLPLPPQRGGTRWRPRWVLHHYLPAAFSWRAKDALERKEAEAVVVMLLLVFKTPFDQMIPTYVV